MCFFLLINKINKNSVLTLLYNSLYIHNSPEKKTQKNTDQFR